jgi:hypothetical protein
MPTSMTGLLQQVLGLFTRSFSSMGSMLNLLFVSFIRFSPLPDEVDFLLICLLLIWVISLIIRWFRRD